MKIITFRKITGCYIQVIRSSSSSKLPSFEPEYFVMEVHQKFRTIDSYRVALDASRVLLAQLNQKLKPNPKSTGQVY